ncbi:FkbM family methyltransferase [Candidatus Cardinium hertigii]|uniref:FkbM family methyltransferase n=1 Tax=Candidatus Cardinium hertigii TaxID=247481 RepID=UPI003D7CDC22
MKQFYRVIKRQHLKTRKLDEISKGKVYDFLKIDVQGYELEVLKNGIKTLLDVSAVHIEVSFVQKYTSQPLFRDIDYFLSNLGFKFHCFTGYGTRTPKTIYINNNPVSGINQWLWADAVYFKDIDNKEFWNYKDQLIKFALIAHHIYQSYDYAAYALKKYDHTNHTFYLKNYLMFLAANKGSVQ